jgi:hypothetical protein
MKTEEINDLKAKLFDSMTENERLKKEFSKRIDGVYLTLEDANLAWEAARTTANREKSIFEELTPDTVFYTFLQEIGLEEFDE